MNKKRSKEDKPLLPHAFLSVTHDDQNRFCVKEASVQGLGDIHEPVAETFQRAVSDRIFNDFPHIKPVFFTPLAANDVLPARVVERPLDPAA